MIEWECQNRLPKGLELNSRTGVLSGNATESFTGTITVWARRTDVNMSCYKRFLLTVSQGEGEKPAGELRIQKVENSELKLGVNCSIPLKAQGGMPPYKWKVENLPIGMRSGYSSYKPHNIRMESPKGYLKHFSIFGSSSCIL